MLAQCDVHAEGIQQALGDGSGCHGSEHYGQAGTFLCEEQPAASRHDEAADTSNEGPDHPCPLLAKEVQDHADADGAVVGSYDVQVVLPGGQHRGIGP